MAHFTRLHKVRQALPLKELQFELLWLMTVDTLERLPGLQRYRVALMAFELACHLAAFVSKTLQVRELLVHACLRVASVAPGLRDEGSVTLAPSELAEVTELLKCYAPILLKEQSQLSSKSSESLVKGQLQLSAVWSGFLRCVAALPPQCPHEAALQCFRSVTEVMPILFCGLSAAHAEGAASLSMAIRRQRSLPAQVQAALLFSGLGGTPI